MIRTDGKWKCEFIPVSSDCAADTQTQISNSSKELQLSRDVSLLVTILHTNLAVSFGSTGWFAHLIFCTITFSSHLFCSLVSLHVFANLQLTIYFGAMQKHRNVSSSEINGSACKWLWTFCLFACMSVCSRLSIRDQKQSRSSSPKTEAIKILFTIWVEGIK